jgi:cyclopropane fatty-acyl-phospholipid synthase-like methyltransferase
MIKPTVIADHPIAYESKDHTDPHGTANDNTKNGAYVRELIRNFGNEMRYMDLGCAGGGFVSQFLKYDVFAVGIEGSDYNLKNQRAEWAVYPEYLFTADITKSFTVADENGALIKFDAISAFDVLEHIHKEDLPQLLNNVLKHLKYGGFFIAGIATFPDEGYHVTLENEEWWDALMLDYSMRRVAPMENFGRSTSINAVYEKFER